MENLRCAVLCPSVQLPLWSADCGRGGEDRRVVDGGAEGMEAPGLRVFTK